jgi:hypothetical protein
MATIVTRAAKGTPLTHVEVDANFLVLKRSVTVHQRLAIFALTPMPQALKATMVVLGVALAVALRKTLSTKTLRLFRKT